MPIKKYRHNKTGAIYRHLAVATDVSDWKRDGATDHIVVVYCPDDNDNTIFVRGQQEMETKFEQIWEA